MAFTLEIFARKIDDVLSQLKSLAGHIGGAESSINGHKCGMVLGLPVANSQPPTSQQGRPGNSLVR